MGWRSFLFLFSLTLLVLMPGAFAIGASLNVSFVETGTVTHYYGKYHVVQTEGTVSITNPTSVTFFGIRIPFRETVLNYKQIAGVNETQYIIDNNIFILSLPSNGSITFRYMVSGITNKDPVSNGSVLRGLINVDDIISFNDIRVSLLKGPMEIPSGGGRPNTRIITIRVENPTAANINLTQVEVIKTPSLDVTNQLNRWVFPVSKPNILVPAEGVWEDDIVDTSAVEGQVYWVDYLLDQYEVDFTFQTSQIVEVTITLIEQLNRTNQTLLNVSDQQFIYLLKEVSSSVVQPGDIVTVMLTLLNVGGTPAVVTVRDTIPKGFQFYETPSGSVSGNSFFDNRIIASGQTITINYSIKYVGDGDIGISFFDGATVTSAGGNLSSGKISFIKEYLPKHKLFVQKKVSYLSDENVRVELVMKNIGQSVIKNIILKEALNVEDRFELISRSAIEKGVWSVSELSPHEDFVVEYVTGAETDHDVLPLVFGVGADEVYKTLITDTILKNIFRVNKTNTIEIVGIAAIFVFVVALFGINFGWIERLRTLLPKPPDPTIKNDLNRTHNAITELKEQLKK